MKQEFHRNLSDKADYTKDCSPGNCNSQQHYQYLSPSRPGPIGFTRNIGRACSPGFGEVGKVCDLRVHRTMTCDRIQARVPFCTRLIRILCCNALIRFQASCGNLSALIFDLTRACAFIRGYEVMCIARIWMKKTFSSHEMHSNLKLFKTGNTLSCYPSDTRQRKNFLDVEADP